MLGKLLKYEMKAMGRILLPLYAAIIALAGIFAFSMHFSMNPTARSLMEKFAIISSILFVLVVTAVMIVLIVMVIQRFYKNLLGEEGYLMFSLPVSTGQHILSKLISVMIWILLGMVTGVIAGFLMVGIVSSVPEFLSQMKQAWTSLISNRPADILITLLILFFGTTESICKVYAAISLGHQFNSHRLLASGLSYFGFSILETVLMIPLSTPDVPFGRILKLFGISVSQNLSAMSLITLSVSLIGLAFYGFLSWFLLNRRLNLE